MLIKEIVASMRLKNVPGAAEYIANSPYATPEPQLYKGKWKALFGNDHPVRLEIGMGKGQFIIGMSEAAPEISFIGMEKYSSVLKRAVQKQEVHQLPNLKLVCADAADLEDMFAEGEIDRIYLNFSDPWPKDRHWKRRLSSEVFLKKYERILKDKGTVEMKTDNVPLFDFSLESFADRGWELLSVTRDLHHEPGLTGNIMTEYEAKFSAQGKPVMKLIAVKPETAK